MTRNFKFECSLSSSSHTCSHDQAVPGLKSTHTHLRLLSPGSLRPGILFCFPTSFWNVPASFHVWPVYTLPSLPSGHLFPGTALYSHHPNGLIAPMANPSPPPQGLQTQGRGLLEFSMFISLACLLVFPGASPLPAPLQGSLSSCSLPLPQCPERCPARGQDLPPPELGSPQSRRPGRPLPTGLPR